MTGGRMRLRDVALRIIGGKKTEQRAIDAVPWDHGGPTRPSIVSSEQALGLVPVFAAVRLLASQVASLPLQNYRKTGDLRQRIPAPSLFIQPSVHGTLYDWLHRCVTSLALRGNAYGLITQRDRDQYPTMIEWLHPDDIWCDDRQPSGPGSYTSPLWYWQGRLLPAEDLLHIPWFTIPGRVQGLSPIGACAATISTGLSAQNYTSDWFDNGAVPPGEFRNKEKTVNQTEADIISARLNAAIRRRKPLVYGNDWEYKPISVSAHEAKFVETLKMNATQVAAIYGIPPEMIGGESGGPLTYNTVEQNTLNFVKFTLQPWLVLLEGAFFGLMPRPQYIKFNVDALLRSDLQTRMSAYTAARQIGLQNTDEQRALEDLPPLPSGQGQDYTPLPILLKQAGPQPAEVRNPPREVEVIRTYGYPRGLLSGPEALLELVGRRHDPADPAAMAAPITRKFDPTQPRNPHSGEWIDTTPGDGVKGALKDALRLAGKIDLDPGENLLGSSKLDGDSGGIRMALTEHTGQRMLRLGLGPEGYGKRDRDTGTPEWDGNPPRKPLSKAEYDRLDAEYEALDEEYDSASPARQAEISARQDDIREQLAAGDEDFNGTAKLDEYAMGRLADRIRPALDEAADEAKREANAWDEIEALEAKGNPDPARMAQLRRTARADETDTLVFAEGIVPGSDWGDVHFSVELDESEPYVTLGVMPKGAPGDWGDGRDWKGQFDEAEIRKFLQLLGKYARGDKRSVRRTRARADERIATGYLVEIPHKRRATSSAPARQP